MKSLFAAILFFAISASLASGSITISILNNDDNQASASIEAGDSFSFSISLFSTNEAIFALTYSLQVSPEGSGLFFISSRDITSSPFTFLTSSTLTPNAPLQPSNSQDLGAGTTNELIPAPANTNHFVASFTLNTSNLLPIGNYTISLSPSSVAITESLAEPNISGSFQVSVIPEPTSSILFGLGIFSLLSRRRRR